MPVLEKFEKQPREVIDFDIFFDDLLDALDDTARAEVPVEAFAPDGITLVAVYWIEELRCVKLWFSGGTDKKTYKPSGLFHTTGGRTYEFDIQIRVKEL